MASAKMACQIYKEILGSDRFEKLATQDALVQRLLWASNRTKNPDYSDVKYVEAFIGPDMVNTAPVETSTPTATTESRKPGSNKMSRKPAGCWSDCRNWASASTM
jgi:hypothetical protein